MRILFSAFLACSLLMLMTASGGARPTACGDGGPGPGGLDFSPVPESPGKPFGIGSADSIVFTCSAADSMSESLPALKTAISEAIDSLSQRQLFSIIFFHGDKVERFPKEGGQYSLVKEDSL